MTSLLKSSDYKYKNLTHQQKEASRTCVKDEKMRNDLLKQRKIPRVNQKALCTSNRFDLGPVEKGVH